MAGRKLKNYQPTRFMLPTSHYDKAKADRAVKFIENLRHTKGKWAGGQEILAVALAGAVDQRYFWNCKAGWEQAVPYSVC